MECYNLQKRFRFNSYSCVHMLQRLVIHERQANENSRIALSNGPVLNGIYYFDHQSFLF